MRVGFLGTGRITKACVEALAGRGHSIFVTERNRDISRDLAAKVPGVHVDDAPAVVANSEIVCLALMENVADQVLTSLEFTPEHKIISFMLGVDLKRLQRLCAPTSEICITVPLPMIVEGDCPLPVYPPSRALKDLFGSSNKVISVRNEAALASYFGATAMLSTVLSQLDIAKRWLGDLIGSEASAEDYLLDLMRVTFSGSRTDGVDLIDKMLASLATEGGLNAQLRAHMRNNGVETSLKEGLSHISERLGVSIEICRTRPFNH